MKYRIGQKVVYIGPDHNLHPMILMHGLKAPVPKAVYTIRGRLIFPAGLPMVGQPGYTFEEIVNPIRRCSFSGVLAEMHTPESLLRPLTDISIFERLRKEVEAGGDVHLVRDEVKV